MTETAKTTNAASSDSRVSNAKDVAPHDKNDPNAMDQVVTKVSEANE